MAGCMFPQRMRNTLTVLAGIFLLLLLMLPGCGGGGGGSSSGASVEGAQTGQVAITLTDAPSDFAGYTVDVVAIDLKMASGAEVHTLPAAQRVDFSQYTEMTEFVTAGAIPSGIYTEAALTLDYTNAGIRVEDNDGNIVPVTNIVDVDGNPVTTIKVAVNLGVTGLVILPGAVSHLALDFNLKASNTVDFTGGIPTKVTVSPTLLASLEPDLDKTHRARGMLADVQTDQGYFNMVIKPFIHKISGDQDQFGTLKVVPDDNTMYIIGNVQYQGLDGLAVLADTVYANTPVMVLGQYAASTNQFEAQEVYAGASVPGGARDVVSGNVIARDANTITIKGASLVRSSCQLDFCNTVRVSLDENTVVSKQFSKDLMGIDAISVGQRIVVTGSAGDLDASGNLTMTAAGARLLITHLRGIVQTSTDNLMIMQLEAIDGRKPAGFSFADAAADPDAYRITTGANLPAGSAAKVWGFVNTHGHTDGADFNSQTVINTSNMSSLMHATWKRNGYLRAFSSITDQGLVLDLDENRIGLFHFLSRAGVVYDLTAAFDGAPVGITAPDEGSALFCIAQGLYFHTYTGFAEFAAALTTAIGKGDEVLSTTALGLFNDEQATMKATWLSVRLAL